MFFANSHVFLFFCPDKEEVAEVEPEPLIVPPEVLKFPEQEEHQYYTPLL